MTVKCPLMKPMRIADMVELIHEDDGPQLACD